MSIIISSNGTKAVRVDRGIRYIKQYLKITKHVSFQLPKLC